jgi:hypothetical protein
MTKIDQVLGGRAGAPGMIETEGWKDGSPVDIESDKRNVRKGCLELSAIDFEGKIDNHPLRRVGHKFLGRFFDFQNRAIAQSDRHQRVAMPLRLQLDTEKGVGGTIGPRIAGNHSDER